jgi:hypothetical protein
MKRCVRLVGKLAGLGMVSLQAHAAGGHHAVDDAAVLEVGKCKLEAWAERETGGARTLHHLGTGCRVGAVELGLNLDKEKQATLDAATSFGPQIKWAYPLNDGLSIGAVASVKFNSQSPRYASSTLVLPLTWRVTDTLSTHVNWGRNFLRGGVGQPRGGVSLEWAPISDLSLVSERFREAANNSTRLGARYALTPDVKLDISRARSLNAGGVSWWTAGVSWEFDR